MSNSVPQYLDLHLQTLKCVFFEAHVQYCCAEGKLEHKRCGELKSQTQAAARCDSQLDQKSTRCTFLRPYPSPLPAAPAIYEPGSDRAARDLNAWEHRSLHYFSPRTLIAAAAAAADTAS